MLSHFKVENCSKQFDTLTLTNTAFSSFQTHAAAAVCCRCGLFLLLLVFGVPRCGEDWTTKFQLFTWFGWVLFRDGAIDWPVSNEPGKMIGCSVSHMSDYELFLFMHVHQVYRCRQIVECTVTQLHANASLAWKLYAVQSAESATGQQPRYG